jgi:hypothetical protein
MDENINLTILNEIHKGAKMGMDSISFVSEKVGDPVMKDNLSYEYVEYDKISKRVNEQFSKYGEIPDENDMKDKFMSWMGVQMNTMTDKSNSKIAEMLIQGTTMGIIEGRKLINHNPRADEEVKKLLNEFVTFQENNVEKMKEFL